MVAAHGSGLTKNGSRTPLTQRTLCQLFVNQRACLVGFGDFKLTLRELSELGRGVGRIFTTVQHEDNETSGACFRFSTHAPCFIVCT